VLALLLSFGPVLAQQGKNGAFTVTSLNQQVNAYSPLAADAAAGAKSITVVNALNTNFSTNLAAGDLVMIIQMQGASISTTADATFGTITAYNGAGNNEMKEVASVSGNTITFGCGLTRAYTVAGKTQVVRVPRFSSLSFNTNTSLTAPAWNGQTGGVLPVEVQNNVSLVANSGFNVDGLGFRGGAVNNASFGQGLSTVTIASNASGSAGQKGESIAGSQADYQAAGYLYGRGAPANGGGGGSSHNASGGGGANGNNGVAYTGTGNPAAGYAAAWNLESPGFASSTSSGGGRGGYSYSAARQDPATVAPGNNAWGGNLRRNVGGLGGRPLDVSGGRLFLGGGGGASDTNDGSGTAGGNGGGIVYLTVGGNVTAANATSAGFSAAGASVTTASINDGAAGGGGGGAVVLNVAGTVSSGVVNVPGGTGGSQNIGTDEAEGAGGGGGGGYVAYTNISGTTLVTNGGNNGTTNSLGVNATGTPFPPNGATVGGAGRATTVSFALAACVAPVPNTLGNTSPITNTAGATVLSPSVSATAGSGAVAYYTVTSLPTSGTLTYNGTALTTGNIAATQITNPALLTYTSQAGATGTFTFGYTATDTNGLTSTQNNNGGTLTSGPATYTIAVQTACNPSYFNGTVQAGLSADYYSGYLEANGGGGAPSTANTNAAIAFFAANTAGLRRIDPNLNFTAGNGTPPWPDLTGVATGNTGDWNTYSARYRGNITITTGGSYTFTLASDDASYMWIDGAALAPTAANVFINNGGLHGVVTVTGTVTLSAGRHNVLVYFGENTGGNYLSFQYSGADTGGSIVQVPQSVLCAGPATVPPVPNSLTNATPSTTAPITLSPSVSATVGSAAVAYYTVTTLPASGTLTYNGTTLTSANVATTQITNPALLQYAAVSSANGTSVSFQYTTTDVNGLTSTQNNNNGTNANGPATYTLPVALPPTGCQPSYLDGNTYSGLTGEYYSGYLEGNTAGPGVAATNAALAFMQSTAPGLRRIDPNLNYTNTPDNWPNLSAVSSGSPGNYTFFSARYRGSITITTAGSYTFTLNSDDASYMWIDGAALAPTASNALINSGGLHGATPASGTVTLTAGQHNVLLFYGQGPPNQYSISLSYSGADTGNNTVIIPQSVLCAGPALTADLATTITGPATLAAGQPSGTYTATFSNLGPNSTTGATRSVTVPAGATFTAAQLAAITAQGGSVSGTTITFGTTGSLAANATTSFTFAFTAPTTTGAATVVSTVGTGSGTTDPNATNNTSTLNLTVTPVSDVAATISGNGPVAAGGAGSFTATFTNNGPNGPATGTSATVQLPAGLGTVTFTGTTAGVTPTYNNATGVVSFSGAPLTSLAMGSPVTTTINYAQPGTGPGVTGTASVATTSNEAGQTANNAQTATNATTTVADVATSILGPSSLPVGGQATYNVLTTNNGPSTATGVVQTVTIPAGATNVFITGGGVLSGNTITFPALTLTNGQTVNNTVSFTAPGTSGTSYSAVANVTATQDPATTGNNVSSAPTSLTTPTGPNADLNVTLTSSAASAAPNTPVTFTLKQANDGVGTGTGVVSTLNLPSGLTTSTLTLPASTGTLSNGIITYSGGGTLYNGATYNTTTGVLTFPTVTTQAPGAGTTNTYLVTVTTPATGTLTATGAVRGTTSDAEPGNNVSSAQTTVTSTNTIDLATTLTGPTSATPGQAVAYVVTTTNNGPQVAYTVVQTVSIPAGLPITGPNAVTIGGNPPTSVSGTTAFYGSGSRAITYNAATGVVTYPSRSYVNGSSQSSTIAYVAPANGGITLTNTAAVTGSSGGLLSGTDANLANNAATVLTALTPSADVQVSISGPATATAGNPVTYGITTTNNGPSPAASVATTVQLPTGLSGVVVRDAAGNVLTNSATTGYNATDGLVRFPTVLNQTPGTTGAVSGTITLPAPAASNGPLVPVATVASTTADPTAGNNTASVVTSVQPATTILADLSTTIVSNVSPVAAGSPVTFTVTTTNANTSTGPATGVVQTVQLPAGLTTNGGTVTVSNSGVYDNATGLVTFPAVSLAPNTSATNTIVVSQAPGVDPLLAVAAVTGDQTDPTPANNTFVLPVPVTAAPDIATTVSGPASASPGQVVSYAVTTSNVGTTPAQNVTQTLTIPAGVTSYSLNGGPAITVSGPATITIPVASTFFPGAANGVTNTVTFTAPAGLPYTVTGNATATGDAGTAGNNTSSQTTSAAAAGPVASDEVNSRNGASPMANNVATARPITPLSATGGTGTLRYTVTSLPPIAQGVLYLADGVTAVTAGTLLPVGAEATLTFKPAAGFVGNATFLYTATDNNGTGKGSNTATYLIPVNGDLASVYYTNASKGGAIPYANGNEIARVFDPNGGIVTDPTYTNPDPTTTANGTGNGNPTKVPDNGVRAASTTGVFSTTPFPGVVNNLTDLGLVFNPTTGQLTVGDATKLLGRNGTYTFSATTTDVFGGVTTQPVTFTIGANPLPVQLTIFTATAQNLDGLLKWTTASEVNNDRFEVERSLDGVSFAKIGQVAGQGNKTTATNYTLTDAKVAALATGPVYYRLRQVDADGTATFSPVRTVSFLTTTAPAAASQPRLLVYPNPALTTTSLDLSGLPDGTYQVMLYDAAGRAVRSLTVRGQALPQALDIHELAQGTYLIRLNGTATSGQPVNLTQRLTKE